MLRKVLTRGATSIFLTEQITKESNSKLYPSRNALTWGADIWILYRNLCDWETLIFLFIYIVNINNAAQKIKTMRQIMILCSMAFTLNKRQSTYCIFYAFVYYIYHRYTAYLMSKMSTDVTNNQWSEINIGTNIFVYLYMCGRVDVCACMRACVFLETCA